MLFPTTLTTLSAFALLSTNVMAVPSATFDTWDVTNCRGPATGLNHYQSVSDNACAPLPNARSIRVYWTRASSCKVNTFSGPGCSGDLTSYQFTVPDAPCLLVNGKVSYNVTC